MNFSELQSQVVEITKRADLQNTEIPAAIKSSTLKLHTMDFFARDIYEAALTFPSAEYFQSFARSAIARMRKIKWLKKCDDSGNLLDPPLKILTPEQLLDGYGSQYTNVAYEAGEEIQIKCDTQVQIFGIGVYRFPDVTEATFTSWIAQDFPYAIVYDAAHKIFLGRGNTDQQNAMRVLAAEQVALITINNVGTTGF